MTTERAYFGYENSLVERLRQLEPSDPAHQRHVGHEAADEIERLRSDNERLKEWCRKLIDGSTFPGEADSLRSLNSELVAALEETQTRLNMFLTRSDITFLDALISAALAKVKEGK